MPIAVPSKEGRFARLEAIAWWNQALLGRSRVLVVGAGALGNEVIKNVALLGVGHLAIVDMDRVELSNLSRSVLFRETDEGRPKAECAARRAREIFPDIRATPIIGNVLADVGLGWFRWADAVVGALDNREARVFVNTACARVGRPWFDGAIEAMRGIVRGFFAPGTACYECTMSRVDWDLLNQRRSCSLLARRAFAAGGTPTTPTSASVIAAIQVQEVIKYLHGRPALLGRGLVFDDMGIASYGVSYPISPDCPWHEAPPPIEASAEFDSDTPLSVLWARAARRLGGVDAIDFPREIVERLECPACRHHEDLYIAAEKIPAERLRCARCGAECGASFLQSLASGSPLLERSVRQLGLPPWDIIWARHGNEAIGFEISDDRCLLGTASPCP